MWFNCCRSIDHRMADCTTLKAAQQGGQKVITGRDLRHLRAIGARSFVHMETNTKKLDLSAVGRRLIGYSNDSKSYCVKSSATPCIIGEQEHHLHRGNPSCKCHGLTLRDDQDGAEEGHCDLTDDDLLRDPCDRSSALNFPTALRPPTT